MAEILLLHHVCGLTEGMEVLAGRMRAAGHTVHAPDLFGGATFRTVDEGVAFVNTLGDDVLTSRVDEAASALPADIVYAGVSLGVMSAQRLLGARPGARGALLYEAFISPEWAGPWPDGLPAQVHGMEQDPFFGLEGDLAAAREVSAQHPEVEVFTYPGSVHLFSDASLDSYAPDATELLLERSLAFLERV
ncbi:dienelactone hydrolase family protein [Nocardioides bruguierae]|uniref:Dienelactone hydrolase family protein n=1 Tax=Nocardioides bruguierae TaxID=2945102 RepID=A0A9X2D815_9ACTN|nr:dienelactone hydrolase family protein [Nocardioides bruguierae]MCM0620492.1 dienelactone hydrolase family protein [Nocardioides bruguierae]